ncbi:MAG TPA: RluA family pseudouridine synthase [Spirochaetia bacterium]|nr:RluA family pseudouridine synthase [Spirochaetia bacterium]
MDSGIEILYSDAAVIVMTKATGLPSQPDTSGEESALSLAEAALGTVYPVHRIDRPASGLLLLAPHSHAAARLSTMMQSGAIERRYWAIVEGTSLPEEGELTGRIAFDRRRNKSFMAANGKPARLRYTVRTRGERYTLLEVVLDTGRHHQIRVQLADAGSPIRGDLKYGARRSQPGGGIALHAVALRFPHPLSGEMLSFFAPPPAGSLWDALATGLRPDIPLTGR